MNFVITTKDERRAREKDYGSYGKIEDFKFRAAFFHWLTVAKSLISEARRRARTTS
jgi:hypothetical protein